MGCYFVFLYFYLVNELYTNVFLMNFSLDFHYIYYNVAWFLFSLSNFLCNRYNLFIFLFSSYVVFYLHYFSSLLGFYSSMMYSIYSSFLNNKKDVFKQKIDLIFCFTLLHWPYRFIGFYFFIPILWQTKNRFY